MAVEKVLSSGAIIGPNLVLSCTLANKSSENPLFPARNLLNPLRSKRWRNLTDAYDPAGTGLHTYVSFYSPTAILPTFVAVVDPNFAGLAAGTYGTNGFLELIGSTDDQLSQNVVTWALPMYLANPITRICRWYLDTPTGGAAAARNYWGIRLRPNGSSIYGTPGYIELGNLILANYTVVPFDRLQIDLEDPSRIVSSDGGAEYADVRAPFHRVSLSVPKASYAEWAPLRTTLDLLGGTGFTVLDCAATSNVELRKSQDTFYGKWSPTGISFSHQTNRRDVGLQFLEARN